MQQVHAPRAWRGRRRLLGAAILVAALIVVFAAPAASAAGVTCTLSAATVDYGRPVTVTGVVDPVAAGQTVSVALDGVAVASATTDASGQYTASFTPAKGGSLSAALADGTSSDAGSACSATRRQRQGRTGRLLGLRHHERQDLADHVRRPGRRQRHSPWRDGGPGAGGRQRRIDQDAGARRRRRFVPHRRQPAGRKRVGGAWLRRPSSPWWPIASWPAPAASRSRLCCWPWPACTSGCRACRLP